MKLLFFAKTYGSRVGGAEIILKTFLKLLTDDGHFCTLIAQNKENKREAIDISKRFKIIRIPQSRLLSETFNQISEFQPDFIAAQQEWGRQIIRETRKHIIPKMYTIFWPEFSEVGSDELLKLYPVDLVVTLSKFIQNKLSRMLKINSILSYPLVDFDKYIIKNNSKEYITMVNYCDVKGKETFKRISRLIPNEKFLAVRGWEPISKSKIIKDGNITIAGPFEDMRKVYSKTRLLLIPSICEEIFGRVALEAAINEIPVIASNVGGLGEAIGKGGALIDDYQNERVWVKEIKKFNNQKYYQKISLLAVQRAKKYNLRNEYEVIVKAMESILEDRKRFITKIKVRAQYFFLRIKRFLYFSKLKVKKKTETSSIMRNQVIWGNLRRLEPFSDWFGQERGTPVDRYYIENFLRKNSADVKGVVLEVKDDNYTQKFGGKKVKHSDVLDIDKSNEQANIHADLRDVKRFPKEKYDCIILTQVLHLIDDYAAAISSIYKMLKPGGVLLCTLPSTSRIDCQAAEKGDCWRFTKASAKYIFSNLFKQKNLEVESFGNVLVNICYLEGISVEELEKKELDYYDKNFPLTICVKAVK